MSIIEEQLRLEKYVGLRNHELELNRATAAFEHAALKPLTLLNGGATVAFLTLLGAVWKEGNAPSIEWVGAAIGSWCLGLVLAAVATAFGYFSQRAFTRRVKRQRQAEESDACDTDLEALEKEADVQRAEARKYQTHAFAAGSASLSFFVVGVGLAITAMYV